MALACELPAERNVPLSRYSLSELSMEVADRLGADNVALSRSSVWRVLINDALRPWRYRYWIFPRDPHFLERAGPVLDLYACQWQGRPLWADELAGMRHWHENPVPPPPVGRIEDLITIPECVPFPAGTLVRVDETQQLWTSSGRSYQTSRVTGLTGVSKDLTVYRRPIG